MASWFHDKTHEWAGAIAEQIWKEWWAPGIYGAAKRFVSSCPVCLKFSDTRPHKEPGGQPWAYFPFERLQIDYADMPPANGYKHLLVIVDQLSGWVKAFLTQRADVRGLVKALLKEIIPRYGVPKSIESDRGSHFTANVTGQLYRSLGTERNLNTPYHPQCSGQVEWMNRTLKDRIVKTCRCTGLKWPNALNLVLWDIRNTPRRQTGLTPVEILFGRHLAVPGTYTPAKASLLEEDEQLTQYVISMQQLLP